ASTQAAAPYDSKKDQKSKPPQVKIDVAGLAARLIEVPFPAGNYGGLSVNDKALFWSSAPTGEPKRALVSAAITNENIEVKTVVEDIKSHELSLDGEKILIHKGDNPYITDAAAAKADLEEKGVNL